MGSGSPKRRWYHDEQAALHREMTTYHVAKSHENEEPVNTTPVETSRNARSIDLA
jgi:hypothetical protein